MYLFYRLLRSQRKPEMRDNMKKENQYSVAVQTKMIICVHLNRKSAMENVKSYQAADQ